MSCLLKPVFDIICYFLLKDTTFLGDFVPGVILGGIPGTHNVAYSTLEDRFRVPGVTNIITPSTKFPAKFSIFTPIMGKLFVKAFSRYFLGVILVGLLLFLPAWSFRFWQGWLLMGILFIPMFIAGLVMMWKNPSLLEKRLSAKEEQKEQKTVVALSGLLFIGAFVVAGLNWRFGWCVLPDWAVWVAAGLFLICYLLYAEVLRENTYLSRTVEVQENQKVIDSGLYGIVRHPMYTATTVLFLAMPLVLASPISFLVLLLYLPLIVKRIKNEEMVLEEGLEGYREYKQKVKYRLIPLIW